MPVHHGKYVAYYRVSTDRQGKSGLGLEAQKAAVADRLNGGRWQLVAEFVEVESGKRASRKTKATSAPRPAQVETAQLSGRPWLALRSDFLRPDARLVDVNYWLKMRNVEGYRNYDSPRERITPLIVRLLVPKGSEGAPPGAGSSVKRVA